MREFAEAIETYDPALAAGMIDEFRRGWELEKAMAEANNKRLPRVNEARAIDGVGRLRMRIEPSAFHYWGQRLGYECWDDNQFLREFERDVPECRVVDRGTKMQVGYEAQPSSKKFHKVYA